MIEQECLIDVDAVADRYSTEIKYWRRTALIPSCVCLSLPASQLLVCSMLWRHDHEDGEVDDWNRPLVRRAAQCRDVRFVGHRHVVRRDVLGLEHDRRQQAQPTGAGYRAVAASSGSDVIDGHFE